MYVCSKCRTDLVKGGLCPACGKVHTKETALWLGISKATVTASKETLVIEKVQELDEHKNLDSPKDSVVVERLEVDVKRALYEAKTARNIALVSFVLLVLPMIFAVTSLIVLTVVAWFMGTVALRSLGNIAEAKEIKKVRRIVVLSRVLCVTSGLLQVISISVLLG